MPSLTCGSFKARCNSLRLPSCGLVIRKLRPAMVCVRAVGSPWYNNSPSFISNTSRHCSASSRYEVLQRINIPSPASSCTICHSSRREIGSTPTPGSSSSNTFGSPTRVQARPSFCFIPPESLPARRPVNGPRDVNSSRRAKVCFRASPVTLRKSAYRLRFSITVRSSYRPNFCGI